MQNNDTEVYFNGTYDQAQNNDSVDYFVYNIQIDSSSKLRK